VYNHQRKNEQRYREQPDINVGDAHDDTYGNTAGYRHDDQQHHDYEDAGGYDDNYYLHEPLAARADDGYNGYSSGSDAEFETDHPAPSSDPYDHQQYEYQQHPHEQYAVGQFEEEQYEERQYEEGQFAEDRYAEAQFTDNHYSDEQPRDYRPSNYRPSDHRYNDRDYQYANDSYHGEESRDAYDSDVDVYEQDFDVDGFNDHTDTFETQIFEDRHLDSREFESTDYAGTGHTTNELVDPAFNDYAHGQAGALYDEDFKDVGRSSRNRFTASLGKIAAGSAIALFTIGVAALTMFASKPQLTPAEIVQMEGYQGTERTRSIYFNLASLRDCNTIQDCDGVIQANGSDSQTKTTYGSNRESMENYLEIPAVATPSTDGQSAVNGEPWSVKKQWSIVRESPERNSPIVASLEADSRVTVIREIGEWKEVSTSRSDSKSVVTGYMHSSLLQPVSR
jgi:hypothetical protein